MSQPSEVPCDGDLLSVDRELTEHERRRLEMLGRRGWIQVMQLLALRAKASYNVAHSKVFTRCVQQHMDDCDRDAMIAAEVYTCPTCGTILKDRKSPVASSILLERGRLRAMWLDVEQAKAEDFDEKLNRFRRALGLPQ